MVTPLHEAMNAASRAKGLAGVDVGQPEMKAGGLTLLNAISPVVLVASHGRPHRRLLLLLLQRRGLPSSSFLHPSSDPMTARSFILWLHGLSDSGPVNEPIRTVFSAPEFKLSKWSFPSAPRSSVSCNCTIPYMLLYFLFFFFIKINGMGQGFVLMQLKVYALEGVLVVLDSGVMPSWFYIYEIPVTSNVHAMIEKEVDNGVNSENIFVFGFTQGGALRLASVLLYQRIMGGGAVYSGWVPFNSSIIERISPEAKTVFQVILKQNGRIVIYLV
ncbi:hypothetical protein ZIOFF_046273 [Zingiber officinale]|uniref:Phospholipase/carboxylesterase/thioesterase domain-containing protein n=1 Tax=Zingiber officinale TaxID=94328 RepID=A0A8J5G2H2_ZINOF|nr:hypothetical protein ZIOFF_046273 [Zingiber officinale]